MIDTRSKLKAESCRIFLHTTLHHLKVMSNGRHSVTLPGLEQSNGTSCASNLRHDCRRLGCGVPPVLAASECEFSKQVSLWSTDLLKAEQYEVLDFADSRLGMKLGDVLRKRGAPDNQGADERAARGAPPGSGKNRGGVRSERLWLRGEGPGKRRMAFSYPQPQKQHDRCRLHFVCPVASWAPIRSSQQICSQRHHQVIELPLSTVLIDQIVIFLGC